MSNGKQRLSTRSAGVRRLLQEASELAGDDGGGCYAAAPLEDDLFSWHFTIKGPGGDFQEGVYHGRIVLPAEYPFKPPEVYMLTPSGRFEVNKKICLSISSFHPETWQPSWGIRTALVALSAFFASEAKGAVGSLDAPPHVRRQLARSSHTYTCVSCGFDASKSPFLLPVTAQEAGNSESLSQSAPEENDEAEEVDAPSPSQSPPPAEVTNNLMSAEASAALFPTNRVPSGLPTPAPPHAHTSASNPGTNPHHHGHGHVHHHHPHHHHPPSPSGSEPASLHRHHHHHQHHHHHHDTLPAAPAAPQLPVLHHRVTGAAREEIVPPAASHHQAQVGGPPLWIDRAILAVLLAILASVVRKLA